VKQHIPDPGFYHCVPGMHGNRGPLRRWRRTLGLADGIAVRPVNGGQRNHAKKAGGK
jgi:hypothetical protein